MCVHKFGKWLTLFTNLYMLFVAEKKKNVYVRERERSDSFAASINWSNVSLVFLINYKIKLLAS